MNSYVRNVVIVILFLSIIAVVRAQGLAAVSPTQGAVIDPTSNAFTFSTQSAATVSSCSLLIDNATVKTAAYNDKITGRNLQYLVPVEDGNHTWQVTCATDAGELSTPVRQFSAKNPPQTGVKITPSGVFRGSFDHAFKFSNSPDQKPIVVDKLAAGDFIVISLAVPPSTLTKSLYVKQQSSKNGKQFLWLQDQKTWTSYYLYQGENTTINVSTSKVILSFQGVKDNKATVVVYPNVSATRSPEEAPNTTESTANEVQPNETEQQPTENRTPENPQQPTEQAKPTQQQTPPGNATPPAPQPPTPGLFKRILNWFANLLG